MLNVYTMILKHQCMRYNTFLRINKIIEAIKDYKYLLNRGYNPISALNLISNHYGLSKRERLAIYRSIHDDKTVSNILKKKVKPENLSSDIIVIDGFNVLITLKAAITCQQLIKGDDGFLRDILGVFGHVRYDSNFFKAVYYLAFSLNLLDVVDVVIVFDKNVKWSKLYSDMVRKIVSIYTPYTRVVLAAKSDKKILSMNGIKASSDIVILMGADKIFDLAGYIIVHYMRYDNIVDFSNPKLVINI